MITSCINCGAIIKGHKCEYCGTEYNDKFVAEIEDNIYGELKYKGQVYKVYLSEVECSYDDCMTYSGGLMEVSRNMHRIFTLVEYS